MIVIVDLVLGESTWISSGICMDGNVVRQSMDLVQYEQIKFCDLSTSMAKSFLAVKCVE